MRNEPLDHSGDSSCHEGSYTGYTSGYMGWCSIIRASRWYEGSYTGYTSGFPNFRVDGLLFNRVVGEGDSLGRVDRTLVCTVELSPDCIGLPEDELPEGLVGEIAEVV